MAFWVFPWDSRLTFPQKVGAEVNVMWGVLGEVFGIGSPLKDVLPEDHQAVTTSMGMGFVALPPFFFSYWPIRGIIGCN